VTKNEMQFELLKPDRSRAERIAFQECALAYGIAHSVMQPSKEVKIKCADSEFVVKDGERLQFDRVIRHMKEWACTRFSLQITHLGRRGEIINRWGWRYEMTDRMKMSLPRGTKISNLHPMLRQFESISMDGK